MRRKVHSSVWLGGRRSAPYTLSKEVNVIPADFNPLVPPPPPPIPCGAVKPSLPGADVAPSVNPLDSLLLCQQRPESVLAEMHAQKQCTSCGLRVSDYAAHLDDHFAENRAAKEARKRTENTRPWYVKAAQWAELGTDNKPVPKAVIYAHPGQDARSRCALCYEKFAVEYSDEAEGWIAIKAVKKRVNGKEVIIHETCL